MKEKSFEENLELAKEYIDKLLDSEVTLEESIELYKKALDVINNAQKMLEEAKLKVEEIDKKSSGVES
jgi:exodeoxyribonuclease VII small subunit